MNYAIADEQYQSGKAAARRDAQEFGVEFVIFSAESIGDAIKNDPYYRGYIRGAEKLRRGER